MAIKETKNSIVLENEYARLELSKKDATVLSIKAFDGSEILAEKNVFFKLIDKDGNAFENEGLSLDFDVLVLKTSVGELKIRVIVRDKYFIFEGMSALPEKAYCLIMAELDYEYDIEREDTPRAVLQVSRTGGTEVVCR